MTISINEFSEEGFFKKISKQLDFDPERDVQLNFFEEGSVIQASELEADDEKTISTESSLASAQREKGHSLSKDLMSAAIDGTAAESKVPAKKILDARQQMFLTGFLFSRMDSIRRIMNNVDIVETHLMSEERLTLMDDEVLIKLYAELNKQIKLNADMVHTGGELPSDSNINIFNTQFNAAEDNTDIPNKDLDTESRKKIISVLKGFLQPNVLDVNQVVDEDTNGSPG